MVGGIVIGIARKRDETTLHVQETRCTDTCCVDVLERRKADGQAVTIGIGDEVWWQCGLVMWTPKSSKPHSHLGQGVQWDIVLTKVGYTHHSGHALSAPLPTA